MKIERLEYIFTRDFIKDKINANGDDGLPSYVYNLMINKYPNAKDVYYKRENMDSIVKVTLTFAL